MQPNFSSLIYYTSALSSAHRTSSYLIPKGFMEDHVISLNSLALGATQVFTYYTRCRSSFISAEMPLSFLNSLDNPVLANVFS